MVDNLRLRRILIISKRDLKKRKEEKKKKGKKKRSGKFLIVDYVLPKVSTIPALQIALIYHTGGSHFPFSGFHTRSSSLIAVVHRENYSYETASTPVISRVFHFGWNPL